MSGANTKKSAELTVRLFVACPRSGSTLLMRIFAESPECGVTSRLMLMDEPGLGVQYAPNDSILQSPTQHPGECLYDLLPSAYAYDMARPIFLIRDPIRVFDS
ncbi:hypothetical protein LY78DRAFT_683292 [Colletotrichum sublineola]|nr:hypothetical protein LY78DRAFT_683292 [Colletotrichum sublineola]